MPSGAGTCPLPEAALGVDSVRCLVWPLHSPVLEDGHDNVPSVPSKSPCWNTLFPKAERVDGGGKKGQEGRATSLLSRQKSTENSPGSEGNIGKGSPGGK